MAMNSTIKNENFTLAPSPCFILKNARPLELSLYRFYFENATKESVIKELVKYQNEDGGFGHGIEADNWNPNSNPIAVNDALFTLYRINALNPQSDVMRGILRYLSSKDSFDRIRKRWMFVIESNNDYPHAIWWGKGKDDVIQGFNPTVSLAAFMCCYGEEKDYYADIIRESIAYLQEVEKLGGDDIKCYLLAYEILKLNNCLNITDMDIFFKLLQGKILDTICKDTEKYGVEYVTAPSDFFDGRYMEFINDDIQEWIDFELKKLPLLIKEDGGFDITWQWYNEYKEFEQARSWWRPRLTLDKLLFIKANEK